MRMSAFTNSGRSDSGIWSILRGSFRPGADILQAQKIPHWAGLTVNEALSLSPSDQLAVSS